MFPRSITLLGLFFVALTVAQDPCNLPVSGNGYWFGTPSELTACINSLPYDSTRTAGTIVQLRLMTEMYSFTDIAKMSLAPWNINVDLLAGLDEIESGSYSTSYEFHVAISRLLNQLNDAHTRYMLPRPFSQMFYLRPFGLRAVNNNGAMKFYTIQPVLGSITEYSSAFGFYPTSHYNKEVTKIDGVPTLEWLQTLAEDYTHGYKDPQVRLNAALYSFGSFVAVDGTINSLLEVPATHEMILDGTPVTVPNMAIVLSGIPNTSYAIDSMNYPASPSLKRSLDFGTSNPDIHLQNRQKLAPLMNKNERVPPVAISYNSMNTMKKSTNKRASMSDPTILPVRTSTTKNLDLSVTTRDYGVWRALLTTLDGNNVPVLRVSSFLPTDSSTSYQYVGLIEDFTAQLERNQFNSAIIDVSGNGPYNFGVVGSKWKFPERGGVICLANYLLTALVEEFDLSKVYGTYDLRRTDTNNLLVQNSVISTQDYLQPDTLNYYNNIDSWFRPRENSLGRNVSQLVLFPRACEDLFQSFPPSRKFFPNNLVIITDGRCGSACAYFVAKMQEYGKAKIVTQGGTTNGEPMTTGSFAGGNVKDWPTFITEVNAQAVFDPFSWLPSSAVLTFNQHEVYLKNTDTPLEFLFSPSQYHLYYWDAIADGDVLTDDGQLSLVNLYESASQALGSITQKSSSNVLSIGISAVVAMTVAALF